MDRLEAMSLMLTAVESGSLSKASRKLGLPLATVSRKVADLEAHLKATLLIRSSKGLDLTPAGRAYVLGARNILDQLTEIERAASGEYAEPRGDLVVTAPILFGRLHILPVVTAFLAAYPDVSVGLHLTDRVAHFLEDQVDVALRIGDLQDSSLIAARIGTLRRVVCASPQYLSARTAPVIPTDLVNHSVVSFENVASPSTWMFYQNDAEMPVEFRSRLSVNTIDAAIDASLDGFGLIRAMSYQVAEHIRFGRLSLVLEGFEPAPRPVHLVYSRQGRVPLKVRAFMDFVVPRLKARLKDIEL